MVRVLSAGLFAALLLVRAPLPGYGQDLAAPPQKYQAAITALEGWIGREVESKRLPSVAIALVDDQEVVWAHGFGQADPATGAQPAPAPESPDEPRYRFGDDPDAPELTAREISELGCNLVAVRAALSDSP